jgi:hypothetical protein
MPLAAAFALKVNYLVVVFARELEVARVPDQTCPAEATRCRFARPIGEDLIGGCSRTVVHRAGVAVWTKSDARDAVPSEALPRVLA